ncbi:MAG: hydrogenase maturation nickel metallochaperone HypA [Alphaproteobacteria bacterium]|jgi:hydrogenase nickel incorporation protein HypA/HybF|nr:hydrogenase maturation nickel metallochaperone HypA [Alphaproteobacteria bacterium]
MHELSLCESILDIIEEHARTHGFHTVRSVRIEVGMLSCAEPEALRFGFEVVTRGTVAEGAVLEIDRPPGEAWCWDCETLVPVADRVSGCPACGGFRLELHAGDQMRVTELDVD